ncbi:MAG: hypothetical protein WBQ60_11065 [Asticcacaulis sp.]
MNAKIFYPVAALVALLLIALSFVWPQGLGLPSPAPFGHAQELPDYYRMVRERDARRAKQAAEKAAQKVERDKEAAATSMVSEAANSANP